MTDITFSQERILFELHVYLETNGYSPTFEELAKLSDLSYTATARNIKILERGGYVARKDGVIWRSLELTDKAVRAVQRTINRFKDRLNDLEEVS